MASLTRWTRLWVNSGSWWWTGRPGVLRFMGSQRVGHDWATELNWEIRVYSLSYCLCGAQQIFIKYFIFCVFCVSDSACLILCDTINCSLPHSSIHGVLQARILEWIAMPFSRGSSWPRDQTQVSCIADRFFTTWAQGKPVPIWTAFLPFEVPNYYPLLSLAVDGIYEDFSHFDELLSYPGSLPL